MFKCPLCDKEYENGRQLHGHMLKAHQAEYKKAGNRVANMKDGGKQEELLRPDGFKLLNKSIEIENAAYLEGYRYRDNENFYTSAEAKKEGWI